MRVAITGAASGIGAATAAILKGAGAEVIAFDIVPVSDNVDRWIETDMADDQSINAAMAQLDGKFDALLNIAGLPPRDGLGVKLLEVNYFGLVAFTEKFLPLLNEGASIVNLASRAGENWRDNIGQVKALMALDTADLPGFLEQQDMNATRAYSLSKEAVIVWTMAQSEALLKRGLRMNCVSPSAVDTGILPDFIRALGQRAENAIARAGRPATSEEIAEVVTFLAEPRSHWVKGTNITPDGGMSAMAISDAFDL